MIARFEAFFRAILEEAKRNPQFRESLDHALGHGLDVRRVSGSGKQKARNRREAAVLNPYEAIKAGDASLKKMLEELNLEQLKDVVSQFAIDSSKLALKWKNKERLVELIMQTTKGRLEKGDAFRN